MEERRHYYARIWGRIIENDHLIDQTKKIVKHIDNKSLTTLKLELKSGLIQQLQYIKFGSESALEQFVESTISGYIQNLNRLIDAACLVFIHSALDSMVDDLLIASLEYKQDKWLSKYASKIIKLTIQDIKNSRECILHTALENEIKCIQREKLSNKIKYLLEITGRDKSIFIKNYKYDKKEIDKLDNLRHEYVHPKVNMRPMINAQKDLRYLQNTMKYLFYQFCFAFPDDELFLDFRKHSEI